MKIPANVSGLKTKLSGAFTKKPDTAPAPKDNNDDQRRNGNILAKEREKRKALTDELADVKTTAERRQEIINQLQSELEAAKAELEAERTRASELEPRAKEWENYEHRERVKLIEQLTPELKKDAKDLPLNALRTFVKGVTGGGSTSGGKQGGQQGDSKWGDLIQANDPAALDKAIADDPKGFNDYMEKAKK